jgi:LSD1 subclass zinc finger protein
MGGGALAQTDRLRFAAFDLLLDSETEMQRTPYPTRVARLENLLRGGSRVHCARCETVGNAAGVAALFECIVTRGSAEGLVLHASDGRTFKVKPEISIDAAVIGYVGTEHGLSELLLALLTPSGRYQTIGRIRTGWSRHESKDLATRLAASACASSSPPPSRMTTRRRATTQDQTAARENGQGERNQPDGNDQVNCLLLMKPRRLAHEKARCRIMTRWD